jgi:hypothetical protein
VIHVYASPEDAPEGIAELIADIDPVTMSLLMHVDDSIETDLSRWISNGLYTGRGVWIRPGHPRFIEALRRRLRHYGFSTTDDTEVSS